VVLVLITGFAAGYLINIPVVSLFGFPLRHDGRNVQKLRDAFGRPDPSGNSSGNRTCCVMVFFGRLKSCIKDSMSWCVACFLSTLMGVVAVVCLNLSKCWPTAFVVLLVIGCVSYGILLWSTYPKSSSSPSRNKGSGKDIGMSNGELVVEFSLRLHSHAPAELIAFLTRRLNSMYVALSSGVAILLGHFGGLLFLCFTISSEAPNHICALLFICSGTILVAFVLFRNGLRAKDEHWDIVCGFIAWDVKTHEFPVGE
ncbi:MAG: hypothetical protein L3K26_01260, partial [Candidatus Hydrogenedentes bacterium]|nr:hypothetical protein [Candidatus Hydrogenedentota bacterium]